LAHPVHYSDKCFLGNKNFSHFTGVKRNGKDEFSFSRRLKTGSDVTDLISWGSFHIRNKRKN